MTSSALCSKVLGTLTAVSVCAALPMAAHGADPRSPSASKPIKPGVMPSSKTKAKTKAKVKPGAIPGSKAKPRRRVSSAQRRALEKTDRMKTKLPGLFKTTKLINGKVQVDPVGKEFPTWLESHAYVETPQKIKVKWFDNDNATEVAQWELYEEGSWDKPIASGSISPLEKANSSRTFTLRLADFLPKYNTSDEAKTYRVRVRSSPDELAAANQISTTATLTHLAKSSGSTGAAPEDPFTCSAVKKKYERVVSLYSTAVGVASTTNTPYEGADELFFHVMQVGPGGLQSAQQVPGGGDAYKVVAPNVYDISSWRNKDGDQVSAPLLWAGNMKHGDEVTLGVLALEDDWDNLKKTKNGIIDAMTKLASSAGAIPYVGPTIAAVAGGVAVVNELYVPDIDEDDLLGGFGVRFTNRCGRIQTVWVTADSQHGGKTTSQFLDFATLDQIPSGAMTAMFVSDSNEGFSPSGWDYGDYAYVGEHDPMHWLTLGTSNSAYAFTLLASTAIPQ